MQQIIRLDDTINSPYSFQSDGGILVILYDRISRNFMYVLLALKRNIQVASISFDLVYIENERKQRSQLASPSSIRVDAFSAGII